MRAKWFGTPWHSSICHPDYQMPIPMGEECDYCAVPFDSDSQGVQLASEDMHHRICLNKLILGPEVAELVERCGSGQEPVQEQQASAVAGEEAEAGTLPYSGQGGSCSA